MGERATEGLRAWHDAIRQRDPEALSAALDEILDDEVVFHSPVVHTPQHGKGITKLYLMAAFNVLPGEKPKSSPGAGGGSPFRYVREVVGDADAVLEFETSVEGIHVNGVDMLRWNDAGRLVDIKVMVRPLKAIQKVHAQMGAMLEAMKSD